MKTHKRPGTRKVGSKKRRRKQAGTRVGQDTSEGKEAENKTEYEVDGERSGQVPDQTQEAERRRRRRGRGVRSKERSGKQKDQRCLTLETSSVEVTDDSRYLWQGAQCTVSAYAHAACDGHSQPAAAPAAGTTTTRALLAATNTKGGGGCGTCYWSTCALNRAGLLRARLCN